MLDLLMIVYTRLPSLGIETMERFLIYLEMDASFMYMSEVSWYFKCGMDVQTIEALALMFSGRILQAHLFLKADVNVPCQRSQVGQLAQKILLKEITYSWLTTAIEKNNNSCLVSYSSTAADQNE